MRIIEEKQITKTVAELCIEANINLGGDIKNALAKSRENETNSLACYALDTIIENAEIAKCERLPICQDTGLAVIFVDIGTDVHINGDITKAINDGVRQGYKDGYFRASIVKDPIDRVNTLDNTPAIIHYDFVEGDKIHITAAPKGFGSENMSAIKMLNPSDGIAGVEDFVLDTVKRAGANPCPPIIVGVGVGGNFEKAAILAKKALLREVGSSNPNPFWAEVEVELLDKINSLGIGPAGYGGKTTALSVNILTHPTHIAGLPCAVNIGCHVNRHKEIIL